ncbi:MAG: thymidylate synthase [Candidatus Wildermuthbacteria bacterium RIFCSPLOWO2_01_FULL_48_29]|uniref:Thymidylate synthase n=2 Tax=Candidatus Wildermuthiibacteriota TaxID=1817923 RepID=A0A1G2RKD6_9BACT|nr:MAG: thymidylate synthase [Candidatus Wildermuthbacteria bacterium RIFCSPHIGHO2_01_FULL_48_27b]OHA73303.1 MAG: thymidylate synthase [Candidatus Wildermuthbacteria bacterium RIFCSPLOWO2_01_FULL_48_29]
MKIYLDLLQDVLESGVDKPNRTGIDQRTVFGRQMRFNMADGFPAITTKKLAFNAVKAELLWFLSGSSDVKDLQKLGCHIWDANAQADYWKPKARFEGDLGRVYGVQWRSWNAPGGKTIDQIKEVIEKIKINPNDRRLLVSAWNPGELDQMALPPCHVFFQFFVSEGQLSLQMYQRSCDMFLGVPFNIASYALLLHMIAQVTNLKPGEFIHILGDTHIYHNHFDQVKEQLKRTPYPLPTLSLNPQVKDIDEFGMDDIQLRNYQHHPALKAEMAV